MPETSDTAYLIEQFGRAPFKRVSRDEWRAHIERYPTRRSYRTGICEPPQEICEHDGVVIARIVYPYREPQLYFIREA
jgi:hypothetical protein